jgi:hypothetical protein
MQHHMSDLSEVGGVTEPSSIIPSIEAGLPSPLASAFIMQCSVSL